jgi:hypothetical protein
MIVHANATDKAIDIANEHQGEYYPVNVLTGN